MWVLNGLALQMPMGEAWECADYHLLATWGDFSSVFPKPRKGPLGDEIKNQTQEWGLKLIQ